MRQVAGAFSEYEKRRLVYKLKVARLPSVFWMFATFVRGAVWKRSAPLQAKRIVVQVTSAHCLSFVLRRVLCASNQTTTTRL
jgi:hypothetical protein